MVILFNRQESEAEMIKFLKRLFGFEEFGFNSSQYIVVQPNEIEIRMSDTNEPPFIRIKGKRISNIIDVQYNYSTKTRESNGVHNFTVRYVPDGKDCIETIVVNKILEGDK